MTTSVNMSMSGVVALHVARYLDELFRAIAIERCGEVTAETTRPCDRRHYEIVIRVPVKPREARLSE